VELRRRAAAESAMLEFLPDEAVTALLAALENPQEDSQVRIRAAAALRQVQEPGRRDDLMPKIVKLSNANQADRELAWELALTMKEFGANIDLGPEPGGKKPKGEGKRPKVGGKKPKAEQSK
jgi:HEAT repeat protein